MGLKIVLVFSDFHCVMDALQTFESNDCFNARTTYKF